MSDDWQVRKDIDRLMSFLDDDSINMTLSSLVSRIDELEQTKTDIDKVYPIGAVYISVNNSNPSELFGGTWEKIEGRFLLARSNKYPLGSTGGEATHTLTVDEMPSHNHSLANNGQTLSMNGNTSETTSGFTSGDLWNNTRKANTTIANTGGGEAHNNMPPYLTVNVWKRTS